MRVALDELALVPIHPSVPWRGEGHPEAMKIGVGRCHRRRLCLVPPKPVYTSVTQEP